MGERFNFAELLGLPEAEPAPGARSLVERLTFDRLMSLSDPKRITRSATVRVPPLKFDAYKDQELYYFNVKSAPSTTGLRHKGVVKVFKPKDPNTPLERCDCSVDCTCPDYKYRFAWANKQRGSSQVGPSSLNQAWNKAPRITNPTGRPGLCKHIIATRDWIYGQIRSFASDQVYEPTTAKLDRLVKQAQKRWADFPGEMAKARERDEKIKQSIQRATALKSKPWAKEPSTPWKMAAGPDARAAQPPLPEPAPTPDTKLAGARASGLNPELARSGSAKAAEQARRSGDDSVAKWRAARSEESVSRGMPNLVDQLDVLVEEQAALDATSLGKSSTLGSTAGRPGSAPKENESEELKLLREIRDIVRHMAGDDLPPDLAKADEPMAEPGIPVDAAEARDQN